MEKDSTLGIFLIIAKNGKRKIGVYRDISLNIFNLRSSDSLEDVLAAHSLTEQMLLILSNMGNSGNKHYRRSYHMDLILRTLLSAIMVTKELILASFIWYWDCTGTFAYDRAKISRIQVYFYLHRNKHLLRTYRPTKLFITLSFIFCLSFFYIVY